MSTLPSAVAETLPIGLFTDTLPLSSTETPTPGAWIETGALSELAEGVEPAAGDEGADGAEESPDAAGGCVGEDGESELAGSAWVPMWRGT